MLTLIYSTVNSVYMYFEFFLICMVCRLHQGYFCCFTYRYEMEGSITCESKCWETYMF